MGALLLKKDSAFLYAVNEYAAYDNPSGVDRCFSRQHGKGYYGFLPAAPRQA